MFCSLDVGTFYMCNVYSVFLIDSVLLFDSVLLIDSVLLFDSVLFVRLFSVFSILILEMYSRYFDLVKQQPTGSQ